MTASAVVNEISGPRGEKIVEHLNAAGEYHRVGAPARVWKRANGQVQQEDFFVEGRLHQVAGPAQIGYYEDGQIDYKLFFLNGKQHRNDGPARILYYKCGKVKRESFYMDGKLHREEGPAKLGYHEDGSMEFEEFWMNNVELTPKEFLYKTYIDKLSNQVLREQATQLAEQANWNITVAQLNKAVGLTLEEKPAVKCEFSVKAGSLSGRKHTV